MTALSELKDVEILSVGPLPERGLNFTQSDLKEIAANTNALLAEKLHNPPGKLGHDDKQVFARESGLPAAGWAHNLRVKGDKLIADFESVPAILMEAFKKKLYSKISSEVYFGLRHPKTQAPMGKVLRAVAFLGADIPQVKGLASFMGENPKQYAFTEGEYANMGEVTITINLPTGGAPGPITAEGLAGTELAYYRQSESIAKMLSERGVNDFGQDASVESLLRYVGHAGGAACLSQLEFRQQPDPEGLVAWLQARAQERGYVPEKMQEENNDMDDKKKIEELTAQLAEAQSKSATSEQAATALKGEVKNLTEQLSAKQKEKLNGDIATFVESHKAVITPAIEPAFRALCESAGYDEVEVKLTEKPEKLTRVALAFKFAELVAKAKVVPLGEGPGAGKETPTAKGTAVKGASLHVELHEKAMGLIAENPKLPYKDAVNEALKADPSLAGK